MAMDLDAAQALFVCTSPRHAVVATRVEALEGLDGGWRRRARCFGAAVSLGLRDRASILGLSEDDAKLRSSATRRERCDRRKEQYETPHMQSLNVAPIVGVVHTPLLHG